MEFTIATDYTAETGWRYSINWQYPYGDSLTKKTKSGYVTRADAKRSAEAEAREIYLRSLPPETYTFTPKLEK